MKNNPQVNLDILKHILRYCNNISELIERFGKNIQNFKTDIAYRDSVSMNILQIGELAGKLTEDYRAETKDTIPWTAIKSMRNFFAHNYGNMDLNVIWSTAIQNIPEVKKFCEIEIARMEADGSEIVDDSIVDI